MLTAVAAIIPAVNRFFRRPFEWLLIYQCNDSLASSSSSSQRTLACLCCHQSCSHDRRTLNCQRLEFPSSRVFIPLGDRDAEPILTLSSCFAAALCIYSSDVLQKQLRSANPAMGDVGPAVWAIASFRVPTGRLFAMGSN